MHDLITIDALPPGSLTVAAIDATMAYAEAKKAPATRAHTRSTGATSPPLLKIADQTRHASLDMLRVYSRQVDLFRENSGAGFL